MKDSISRWSLHYEGWAAEHNISCLPRGNRSRGKGLSLLSPCRGGAPPFSPALPSYSVSLLFLLFAPAVTKPHSGRFSSAFRPFCSANPAAGSRNMQFCKQNQQPSKALLFLEEKQRSQSDLAFFRKANLQPAKPADTNGSRRCRGPSDTSLGFFDSLKVAEATSNKDFCFIYLQVVPYFLASTEGFAPAGATRGLSDRPLDPFGPPICDTSTSQGTENSFSPACRKSGFRHFFEEANSVNQRSPEFVRN